MISKETLAPLLHMTLLEIAKELNRNYYTVQKSLKYHGLKPKPYRPSSAYNVDLVVSNGFKKGLSWWEISKETQLPPSTVKASFYRQGFVKKEKEPVLNIYKSCPITGLPISSFR